MNVNFCHSSKKWIEIERDSTSVTEREKKRNKERQREKECEKENGRVYVRFREKKEEKV